ncbi:hypothetical protein BDQ12DRAFT_726586 [Crucibulum laeve]|uniref:Uncharacterized protein n=1 Tax=Crucibulum laeve TaxID=68775 RepID=A0A5C3M152_9AGAR|nr:hypothetical protein BDQ12DRAFT_726586 [Crucibulum laeve]
MSDWEAKHKPECGKIGHIELETFYPMFASLNETAHQYDGMPLHFPLTHRIINIPTPSVESVVFPDESAIKLVFLGNVILMEQMSSEKWQLIAASFKVRSKLLRRIFREGYVLPGVLSARRQDTKQIRLQYHHSPVTHFGIAKGTVEVKLLDQLAYFDIDNSTSQHGQDPDDRYWIYSTTILEEEFILDCNMFTFNFSIVVNHEAAQMSAEGV